MPADAADAPLQQGEFSLGYDDNLAHARRSGQSRGAAFVVAAAHWGRPWPVDSLSTVHLQLGGQGQHYPDQPGLDQLGFRFQARYLKRLGWSAGSPALSAIGTLTALEYGSSARDGGDYRLQLAFLQPLSASLRSRWTLGWLGRRGATVFDARMRQYALDLDWTPAPFWTLYGGYQFRDGDFVSTGEPTPADRSRARAVAPDDVFPGETLLRQSGSMQVGSLGLNHALSSGLALDVQVQWAEAEADRGARYRRRVSYAGLLWRY